MSLLFRSTSSLIRSSKRTTNSLASHNTRISSLNPSTQLNLRKTINSNNLFFPTISTIEQTRSFAGHSHWANIKHKKEKQDLKRMAIFSKLSKEITVAARLGGPDVALNPRLQVALMKARSANLQKATIEHAISKSQAADKQEYEERFWEATVGSVCLIIKTLSESRNRTSSFMKYTFANHSGAISPCMWAFEEKGVMIFTLKPKVTEEKLLEFIFRAPELENIIEDIEVSGEHVRILCQPKNFAQCQSTFTQYVLTNVSNDLESAQLEFVAKTTTELENEEEKKNFQDLLNVLEDNEDVQEVFHNCVSNLD